MRKYNYLLYLSALFVSSLYADGLMMPDEELYPKDFLKLRLTKVNVEIHGVIAKTSVYQEFVNEWDQTVDAVYSFPLPPDARATQFLYWYDDKIYKAVLKVQEQVVNPGTGEGGVAALVNKYIGRNGIKIGLSNIEPGMIQKIQLDYIQLCDYYKGTCSFEYPLKTADFVTHPLDHLEFNFEVHSTVPIISHGITTHVGAELMTVDSSYLKMRLIQSKAYLDRDLVFQYTSQQASMGVDFYSVDNDTVDGHFALFIRPPNQAVADSILPRRIIFLLSNSSQMFGYALNQSISAINQALDQLNDGDRFNIILYNWIAETWQSNPVEANATNIQNAKDYLAGIVSASGADMAEGIGTALSQITSDGYNNVILVFTNGFNYIDPVYTETLNIYKTGIFPIAIGDDFNFARLEMLAAYNYGFVTYIDEDDNMIQKMNQVVNKVTQPILKDVQIEYGSSGLSEILPTNIPSTYAGSYFFLAGRYVNPGSSALSLGGTSVTGAVAYDFMLQFSGFMNKNKFVEPLWAKMMIDFLEWQIEIYGETEELKSQLIELSLTYNIRCRYTAYVADYTTEYVGFKELENLVTIVRKSHLVKNYPNPFNPSTTIGFYISPQASRKGSWLLKIYNTLGQLVYIIDLSSYRSGFHEIQFDGRDLHGMPLASGVYFVMLQIGSEVSTMRIALLR